MSDLRPIGVFDSGMGGLSVLREIRALLPGESLLYCADSANAPYGEKPPDLIQARSLELTQFLIDHGSKAIVVACNTATAAAASALRERWPHIPLLAMEPAVKPAAAATRSGVVGVLATTGTLESARFAALLDNFGSGIKVLTRPGTGLVEAVEKGAQDTPALRDLLKEHLAPMLFEGADVIVLGCTHYVFLRELIQELVGPRVTLIDTGAAVARHLRRRLADAGCLAESDVREQKARFWCSGSSEKALGVLETLWGPADSVATLPPSECMSAQQQESGVV